MGDNIKMDLQEVGWGSKSWIDLAKNRYRRQAVVITVMNFSGYIKYGEFVD